jgi:hypothetical protein
MNRSPHLAAGLDHRLALVLRFGTWTACALIAAGLLLPRLSFDIGVVHVNLVIAGVALLIVLPVARVALMALWFAIHRERQFALIAITVLAIIVLSAVLGAHIA